MALTPGTRLGPYEIVATAGSGGMGEVYRAKDTRLDRVVAIKVLPEADLQDPGRRQRLEREARAVSNLSHPNICTLHDIGHQDGVDYLVMEFLEGETLATRLEKGPLPREQVLRYGMELAGALDAAHRRGIIHRDVKPGNVMLTRAGAKLLDFGLAKATSASSPILTAAPTRSAPITYEGNVVGTFPYMSPEQIEGKELDGRTDIFALGSVLYEMVTGQRAFQGRSHLSVVSAILEKEPPPIGASQPSTPPALDHAIRLCLEKDPEDRWQTARDLLLELKWAGAPAAETPRRKGRERLAWLAAATLAVVAILAVAGWRRAVGTIEPRPLMQLSVETAPGSIFDRFIGAQLAISRDGTRIVAAEYDPAGQWHLAMRRLDQSQFVPIAGTDNASTPCFSPDGEWIAFFAGGKLKKVALQGGAPVTLCDAPRFSSGASWGDDGNIVAGFNEGSTGLVRVPSGGGAPTPLTQLSAEKSERGHAWPQVLPGSQAVLFTVYHTDSDGEITVVLPKTGERKTIHDSGGFSRYLPSGHLVYLRQETLWAAPFDLRRLALTGAPQPVLEEVGDFDFSSTGTVVEVSSKVELSTPYSIWWMDSAGRTTPLHATPGLYENLRFSPDGKRLAFEIATSWRRADVWVKDLERDTTSRLTHAPGRNNTPIWTPDGQAIVFDSNNQPASGLYWTRADGAGGTQRLTDSQATYWTAGAVSPDGRRLAFHRIDDALGRSEIWTAPIEGDPDRPRLGKAELFSTGSSSEEDPAFSPDGRWLAYSSDESGKAELYVRPYPGPGGKTQVSTDGGSNPIWSRAERKLFFLTPDWRIMVAGYTSDGAVFAAGKPQEWSQKKLAYLGGCYPYDLAPDGKRFAVVLNPDTSGDAVRKPTDHVIVLLNFFDELRRKLRKGSGLET
jgi:serine/threonine-protein kinase